jgi:DNA-binding response OmpR family regulator
VEGFRLRRTCRPGTPCSVLLIEDDPAIVELLKLAVRVSEPGCFMIESTSTLTDAVPKLDGIKYDAVLLDLGLPDSEGLATLHVTYKLVDKRAPILVVTGEYDADTELSCFEIGAKEYLVKPFDALTVLKTVRHSILRFRHSQAEAAKLEETGEIIRKIEPFLTGEPQTLLHEAANTVFQVAQRVMGSGA